MYIYTHVHMHTLTSENKRFALTGRDSESITSELSSAKTSAKINATHEHTK